MASCIVTPEPKQGFSSAMIVSASVVQRPDVVGASFVKW
jgi:predicted ATP-grasp superfamily ATP-dependent carboligase